MPRKLRIAMPLTDAFGGHGGIALYNRDVLAALSDHAGVAQIVALPRIAAPFSETVPAKVDWRAASARGAASFVAQAAKVALADRPIDLVWCAHVNLLPVCRPLAVALGARLVLALYGVEAWEPFERSSAIPVLRHVDRIVSISAFTRDRFCAWSNFDPAKVDIVANAIDLDAYSDGPKSPDLVERYSLSGHKVVMILGRMHPTERRKGFDELLEALPEIRAQRPEVVALLAGSGGDMARLQAKAGELEIADAVRFTGPVAEAEKAAHYRLADAYVMPSSQEGFGFVHLEAMACGTPAVGSRADGAREAVRDGAIGQLLDPADRASIVAATLRALDTPRGIPPGLAHFAYPRFARETAGFVDRVMA